MWTQSKVLQQQIAADASAFEYHGQSAPGMRAAANQINTIDVLEAIMRTEVQHLVERMGEVEGGPPVDFIALVPICRSNNPLVTNPRRVDLVTGLAHLLEQEV